MLWANIMTGAVIVMAIALLGVLFVQVKMHNNLLAGVCKTVVVIAAIALLVACAFAGHAGAVQVWNN
ncbi:hypothetical protein [uncultured Corynebacterium sp.]|nr:hypothetical protein [uncultured Corynebacterium sp.]